MRAPAGPAGLLYLCMKHVTDRYNMYYSYAPTKLNEQIHMAAVYQAIFAPLLGLFWMLFFSILRLGRYRACLAYLPLPLKPSAAPLPRASREGPGGARAAHDCSPRPVASLDLSWGSDQSPSRPLPLRGGLGPTRPRSYALWFTTLRARNSNSSILTQGCRNKTLAVGLNSAAIPPGIL